MATIDFKEDRAILTQEVRSHAKFRGLDPAALSVEQFIELESEIFSEKGDLKMEKNEKFDSESVEIDAAIQKFAIEKDVDLSDDPHGLKYADLFLEVADGPQDATAGYNPVSVQIDKGVCQFAKDRGLDASDPIVYERILQEHFSAFHVVGV